MSAHTRGRWNASIADDGGFSISAGDKAGYGVVAQRAPWPNNAEESRANARLIAAAPELLAALRNLRAACEGVYKAGQIAAEPFVRAGNVIADAEGR